jgi:hypothetical protein
MVLIIIKITTTITIIMEEGQIIIKEKIIILKREKLFIKEKMLKQK